MGWLSSIMGTKPSKKVTAQDKAILDLKLQRDKIRQYQKRIAGVVQKEHDLAKQCLANGDKQRALLLLRKKKFQQQILRKTDEQLATLEELASNIEFALVQKDVLYGLEQGNKVLKEINGEMSLERIERIMDESADGIAYQQQVSDMLSERISNSEEDEIQDELERLEREAGLTQDVRNVEPVQPVKLPSAPKGPLAEPEEQEVSEEAEEEHESQQAILA